jgi:hypothetical protein
MKRMGVFCDSADCKNPAIGPCVCCDKDVCAMHGSAKGLTLSVLRAVRDTSSLAQVTVGSVTVCYKCGDQLTMKPKLFDETALPELLARVGDAMKAALSAEALR